MHTYEHITPAGEMPDLPPMETHPFRRAEDVVHWARMDVSLGRITWPDVWHLDQAGLLCCATKGSSLDTIKRWADDPSHLQRSREEGIRTATCPDRWLIIDSRPSGRFGGPRVDEGDAEAFLRLRTQMHAIGVNLLDAVVFDDQCHWWSLHELTSGSTTWAPPPLRQAS